MDAPPAARPPSDGDVTSQRAADRARRILADRTGGLGALQADDWRALLVGTLLIGSVLVAARFVGPGTSPAGPDSTAGVEGRIPGDQAESLRPVGLPLPSSDAPAPGSQPVGNRDSSGVTNNSGGAPSGRTNEAANASALDRATSFQLPTGPGPGGGVLVGRLVDAVTGLPVPDAGVMLLGHELRTISAPDGRFRFGGIPPGQITVVIGPVDGFLARSRTAVVAQDGLDLGILPLLPMTFSALITPDFGGRVAPCDGSTVDFATRAFVESTAVWATCLKDPTDFPAPAPPGRLPLAMLDLSPGDVRPDEELRVKMALPQQPRYAAGVKLDVLRLDLEQLIWLPVATFTVEAGGASATGVLRDLGTFLVAAPPYGALGSSAAGPMLMSFAIHGGADRAPLTTIQAGKLILYAAFDYAGLNNTSIMVRTVDADGLVVFESHRPYTDGGHDDVPMTAGDQAWPPGEYTTTIYQGDPPQVFASQSWTVALGAPTASPVATLPPVALSQAPFPDVVLIPTPPASFAQLCSPPAKWWARVVQAGDTLTDLARRTGSTASGLLQANCLASDRLQVGQLVYLPRPPLSPKPAGNPGPPAWQAPGYKPVFGNAPPTRVYPDAYPTLPFYSGPQGPGALATAAPKYASPDPVNGRAQPTLAPAPWGSGQSGSSQGPGPGVSGDAGAASPPRVAVPTAIPAAPTQARARSAPPGGGAPTMTAPKQTRPPDPTLAPRP